MSFEGIATRSAISATTRVVAFMRCLPSAIRRAHDLRRSGVWHTCVSLRQTLVRQHLYSAVNRPWEQQTKGDTPEVSLGTDPHVPALRGAAVADRLFNDSP